MREFSAAMRRLAERVVFATHHDAPLEIRGGGSKAFYGNAIHGEVLETRELSGITNYEPSELVVTALAGTPLAELEATLASRGQCLPFEPPRFSDHGTVGGMVAAGLAGPARYSVGALRDFVLGVTLLAGSGEFLTFGGQVMKNVAGYDVSRVLAGSMGILGVICEVSLKVMPASAATVTLCFERQQQAALTELNRWSALPLPLNATAWYDERLWVRFSGARAAVASMRQRLGGTEIEAGTAAAWWRDVRDQRLDFFCMKIEPAQDDVLWRLSVPDTVPVLNLPGAQFIEWGGAQRWLRGAATAPQVRSAAAAVGGHATLFRAADKSAGAFTAPSQPSMDIHRRLKQAFDPGAIFNRGRLYAGL